MKTEPTTVIKEAMIKRLLVYKELGEKAILRLDDIQLHWKHHEGDNSFYIAKTIKDERWESLSIPKNRSRDFNEAMKQNK